MELEKKSVYSCRVFTVQDIVSKAPDGSIRTFSVITAPDWAIVIPVLQREKDPYLLMVRQWRHGEHNLSLEFPGGVIEKGETPEEGGRRELLEETGWKAEKITKLGVFNPNPAIMSNHVHIFLAEGLYKDREQDLDDDEYVAVEQIRLEEVRAGMGRPPFVHALMASALCLYLSTFNE